MDETRKYEAVGLIESLDSEKEYVLSKIAAKDGRPNSMGVTVERCGRAGLWRTAVGDDFRLIVGTLITSPVIGATLSEYGQLLIETENSIYLVFEKPTVTQ
jgi:hypothetical protein